MDKAKSYKAFERLLKERKLTKSKVSRDTGIAKSTFTEWGNGVYTPKVDKFIKLSEYFGVPLEYFIKVKP